MGEQDDFFKRKRSTKWMYATLPADMAMGPISTLIALYILQLGGTVIDVSYAVSLGSLMVIIASFLWGEVSDIFNKRRGQIVISYVGLAASFVWFLLSKNVFSVIIGYGFYNFVTTANSTPLNLLVMETAPKQRWPANFSKLQMVGSVGSALGLVIATLAASALGLTEIMYMMLALSVLSILLTVFFVYRTSLRFSRVNFVTNVSAFMSRIFVNPVVIVRKPTVSALRTLWTLTFKGGEGMSALALMYSAIFIFSLGSGLFNAVYPAGLKEAGLVEATIFLILLVGGVVQAIAFYFLGNSANKHPKISAITSSLALRGGAYIFIGAAFLLLGNGGILISSLILYPIASGIAYAVYYTASNTIVFSAIKGASRGSALGAYTALMGIGTFLGSLASGYTSFYLGYWVTFGIAGVLVLISGYIFAKMVKAHKTQSGRTTVVVSTSAS